MRRTCHRWYSSEARQRFDLVLMGEPDCHAYIVRYVAAVRPGVYGFRWCWILTMPRASGEMYKGHANSAFLAKREVEQCIETNWR